MAWGRQDMVVATPRNTIYTTLVRLQNYIKIDGEWYRGLCGDCYTPLKGIYAKLCYHCEKLSKRGHKPQNLEDMGFFIKQFKGDRKEYLRIHYWAMTNTSQHMVCDHCDQLKDNNYQIHNANLSGEYRLDASDWGRLCVKCHKQYDLKLKGGGR